MKTQISRDSFRRDRRYSGVYLQQGRLVTDADWNEEVETARRRQDDALADAVGSGVPRDGGLKITQAVAKGPLSLAPGRLYAGGVGALVTSVLPDPTTPFGLGQQADLPLPAGAVVPTTGYRLYADVWERSLTSLEDPALRDPAFHGADTATRTQTLAQIKWCASGLDPESPAANPEIGDARLTLALRSQTSGADPCDPCAATLPLAARTGNYLFRLEVHAVAGTAQNPDRVTLKWSSENGAEQHAVGTEPADFRGADWTYEFFTPDTDKLLGVHLPGGLTPPAVPLVPGFPTPPPTGVPFVRRWDGSCTLSRDSGTGLWSLTSGRERGLDLSTTSAADADGHVAFAGTNVSIQLSALALALDLTAPTFVAGDYWLAAVREAIHAPGARVLDAAPPAGIRHRYLLLATIDGTGALKPADTDRQQRLAFPALTSLAAGDVDYTANCPSGLFGPGDDTVQKALDRVCGIDATQVAFKKPCDTSVFAGVDPATINTVAKALGLLCGLRAEQIAYANPGDCTTLAGVTTVQEALHRLCLAGGGSGGGCRTTIGVGGDFPTLQTAVDAFVVRGETRFCFCLLPGEHAVDGPLDLAQRQQPLFWSLEGCGPACSLSLRRGGLLFARFASVRLSNLALVIAADSSVQVGGGEEVVIEGCTVNLQDIEGSDGTIFTRESLGLRLGASRLVRLSGNALQANENVTSVVIDHAATFAGGDAVLVDNRIAGNLSIYGSPGNAGALSEKELNLLLQRIQEGQIRLQGDRSLLLARNRLGRLTIGDELLRHLHALGQPQAPSEDVENLFADVHLTDNYFESGDNDLVCGGEAVLTGNAFTGSDFPTHVIAYDAFYVGNFGPMTIINVARQTNALTRSDLNRPFIREPLIT